MIVAAVLCAGVLLPYVGGIGLVARSRSPTASSTRPATCRRRRRRRAPRSTRTTARPCSPRSSCRTASRSPLSEIPKYAADRADRHRGPALLLPPRRRRPRPDPFGVQHQRRRHPGRLDADHAVRQAVALLQRHRRHRQAAGRHQPDDRPQAAGREVRHRSGEARDARTRSSTTTSTSPSSARTPTASSRPPRPTSASTRQQADPAAVGACWSACCRRPTNYDPFQHPQAARDPAQPGHREHGHRGRPDRGPGARSTRRRRSACRRRRRRSSTRTATTPRPRSRTSASSATTSRTGWRTPQGIKRVRHPDRRAQGRHDARPEHPELGPDRAVGASSPPHRRRLP